MTAARFHPDRRSAEKPSDEAIVDFGRRARAYAERFPDSPYFGSVRVPIEGGQAAFDRALEQKFGSASDDSREMKALRQRLAVGQVAVPFSWRPRVLVPMARTVAQLWELTKRIGRGNPLFTFNMDRQSRPQKDLREETRVPLIDLLSLLIITDLNLWPVLTRVFDRIAITKDTLMRIQHDDGPLSVPSETLVQLRQAIRVYFDKIEQPGQASESFSNDRTGGLEEAKALTPQGRYSFYSDDVVSRVYVLGANEYGFGLNTGQLIRHVYQRGDLGAREAARMFAWLVRSNVGYLTVDDLSLLAIVPNELTKARGLAQKISVLHQDPDYQALASGLWDLPKPYSDTWTHVVRLLGGLLKKNPEIDSDVLAAIWASWLDKVTLAQKLWNAYRALVERRYGARMDELVEKAAIQEVGRRIAHQASNDDEFRKRADDVLTAVRKGLTPDTAPDQYFMEAYKEKRSAQIERERRAPRP